MTVTVVCLAVDRRQLDLQVLTYIVILALAFVLFVTELYPPEISALIVLIILISTGHLSQREALASFGNESIFMIGSLFVLSGGLAKTGLIVKLEHTLLRFGGASPRLTFLTVLLLVAVTSAFISNTATLAVVIPVAISIAQKYGISPAKWLMPIAFASLLGGMNTLIGTSTNIIISGLLPDYGLESFALFTTAQVGLPISIVGLIYLFFFSSFVLGESDAESSSRIDLKYDLRAYTTEVEVLADSALADQTIEEAAILRDAGLTILGVKRKEAAMMVPRGGLTLRANDRLVVEGNIQTLSDSLATCGLRFAEGQANPESETTSSTETRKEKREKRRRALEEEVLLHEVLVSPRSRLRNRTPVEVYLRNRYRISLVAINRHGTTIRDELRDVRIQAGDILVVQFLGHMDNRLLDDLGVVPLLELQNQRHRVQLAPHAALIFVSALLLGAATPVSLSLSCLAGAVAMVVVGVLKAEEIYDNIQWRVLIFLGAVICLGKAMESSGTAAFLGSLLSGSLHYASPMIVTGLFFTITLAITQFLSNQAASVVLIPIAINTAQALGINPMTLVMAVTIAASCCFMTPLEPVCMLVYGPGGYRFKDFVRVGSVLALTATAVALVLIPLVWPS